MFTISCIIFFVFRDKRRSRTIDHGWDRPFYCSALKCFYTYCYIRYIYTRVIRLRAHAHDTHTHTYNI